MAIAAGQSGQRQNLRPFRYSTRQRYRPVSTTNLAQGSTTAPPIDIKQVGFLGALDLTMRDGAAGSGITIGNVAPTLAANITYPFSWIKRVQLALNTGAALLVDLSGRGLDRVNRLLERSYRPDLSTDTDLFAASLLINLTNPLRFALRIPVAANDGADFMLGLINLQSQNLLAQLTIQWAAFADLFTANNPTVSATTPTMDVTALSYAAPDPTQSQLPPIAVHRLIENQYTIGSTGDTTVRINREGLLMRLILMVDLNGAPDSADVVECRIHLNDVDNPYKMTRQQLKHQHIRRYGFDMPVGTFVWDFWHANKLVAAGDQRDFIDTEAFTTLEFLVNIGTAAVLGVGNNVLTVIREILQFPRRVQ
jgi:hypothetical protein